MLKISIEVKMLMRILTLAVALLVCALAHNYAGKAPPTKLQIGVKKEVSDCSVKAKKGQRVSVHYTGYLYPDPDAPATEELVSTERV